MNKACEITLQDLISVQNIAKRLKFANNNFTKILVGENITRATGRGMEYAESRVYQPGDDVRHMDWRVTARHSKPHTKLYHEEKGENNQIILDLDTSMHFGTSYALKSIVASKVAAVLAWTALSQNNNIGGIIFNDQKLEYIKNKNSKKHVLEILNKITKLHKTNINEINNQENLIINTALAKDEQLIKNYNRIFIISDFLNINEETYKIIQKLNSFNILTLIRISDPIEKTELPNGKYNITNGLNSNVLVINNNNKNLLRNFFNEKLKTYNKIIKTLNIKSIEIVSNNNWYNDLVVGNNQ